MARYSATINSVALSSTNDLMTISPPTPGYVKLEMITISGLGTTSAEGRIGVYRSSGGATGGGAITPSRSETASALSTSTVNTTWATQPTLGPQFFAIGCNANGGGAVVIDNVQSPLTIVGGERLSIRGTGGTHNVNLTVIWSE